ncbi:hypothetical protein BGX29_009942 [Mortierella sp. GBA35]|nr:hypothetical protein BGX29_009942 [Mortierella sp. GBA35]
MELYSFQYPPRPIPSQRHRPSRYYFHNLDQDQQLFKKAGGPHAMFQKEGVPSSTLSKAAMHADTAVTARLRSSSGEVSENEIAAAVEVDSLRSRLIVLDRTKFLVD